MRLVSHSKGCGGGDTPFFEWAKDYSIGCAVKWCDRDGILDKNFCSECGAKRGEAHSGEGCKLIEGKIKASADNELSKLIELNKKCPYPYQVPCSTPGYIGSGWWDARGFARNLILENR